MKLARLIARVLLLILLAGCAAPSYYVQAVSGHMKLMKSRQDIDTLLASADTDPELVHKLELAREIRAFGVSALQLPAGDSYLQYAETGGEAVAWNVIAAPEFSLQPRHWCFLVSGCVSYRGYFDRDKADDYAGKLAGKGYDVAISPAIAYSTLGWFDDPLLDTMLNNGDRQLAAFVIHEMAHRKLYVKGDTAFSEAYASFVEELGTRMWLEASGRERQLEDWERSRQATARFHELLLETRGELESVYGSTLPDADKRARKAVLFGLLEQDYETLVRSEWGGHSYYAAWFSPSANNARLALFQDYQGGVCAFSALFESAGGDIAEFHELAAARARLSKTDRSKWLEQACHAIAPNHDL